MIARSDIVQRTVEVVGSKLCPKERYTVGVEIENILHDHNFQRIPANRNGRFSSADLKDQLEHLNEQAGISPVLSIEPGGQMEYGSRPYANLHEMNEEWQTYLTHLVQICHEEDLTLLDLSMEPIHPPEVVPLIDSKKYQLMYRVFAALGESGSWIMKNSTSVQVNLDYASLEEASRLAYIVDCLQPFLSLIFANSPFLNGRTTGERNIRIEAWDRTDPSRCGSLLDHGIYNPARVVEEFAQRIMDAPTIFTVTPSGDVNSFDGSLGEWLGHLGKTGELLHAHMLTALHQIFTHVRFKNILEARVPDRPPFGYELAPAAFLTGLLRVPEVTGRLYETVESWSPETRREVNKKGLTLSLSQEAFDGGSFLTW
ncbi:MAG: glutamate-cysteine ligase family protein, partial [Fidelibacterota bacterium]